MHSILFLRYALLQKTKLAPTKIMTLNQHTDPTLSNKQHVLANIEQHVPAKDDHKSPVTQVDNFYFFSCPHCLGGVQVQTDQVACRIFRHGAYKLPDNPPIGPHTSKEECERLVETNSITGCAKPFLFVFDPTGGTKHYVEKCGYI
jgi:hypothetical protein